MFGIKSEMDQKIIPIKLEDRLPKKDVFAQQKQSVPKRI